MNLAVIPACRKGHNRSCPHTRKFCGQPVIAWSIAAARNTGLFDRVIVATDDEQVAETAEASGAEVPFLLPDCVPADRMPPRPAMDYVIDTLPVPSGNLQAVCCLNPKAPFMSPDDIRAGFDRLMEGGCTYVFAVTCYAAPIQRALRIGSNGHVAMFQPAAFEVPAGDLEQVWHDARQFYWAAPDQWRQDAPVFGPDAVGVPISRHRANTLETPEDWQVAELMFRTSNLSE